MLGKNSSTETVVQIPITLQSNNHFSGLWPLAMYPSSPVLILENGIYLPNCIMGFKYAYISPLMENFLKATDWALFSSLSLMSYNELIDF